MTVSISTAGVAERNRRDFSGDSARHLLKIDEIHTADYEESTFVAFGCASGYLSPLLNARLHARVASSSLLCARRIAMEDITRERQTIRIASGEKWRSVDGRALKCWETSGGILYRAANEIVRPV